MPEGINSETFITGSGGDKEFRFYTDDDIARFSLFTKGRGTPRDNTGDSSGSYSYEAEGVPNQSDGANLTLHNDFTAWLIGGRIQIKSGAEIEFENGNFFFKHGDFRFTSGSVDINAGTGSLQFTSGNFGYYIPNANNGDAEYRHTGGRVFFGKSNNVEHYNNIFDKNGGDFFMSGGRVCRHGRIEDDMTGDSKHIMHDGAVFAMAEVNSVSGGSSLPSKKDGVPYFKMIGDTDIDLKDGCKILGDGGNAILRFKAHGMGGNGVYFEFGGNSYKLVMEDDNYVRVPKPPTSGTATLQSVDGQLRWV